MVVKMVKDVGPLEDAPINVFEAVKRGFIHRGIIPRRYRKNAQASRSASKNSQPDDESVSQEPVAKVPEQVGNEVKLEPAQQEPDEIHEKLIDLTEKAHDLLFKADTVFPFTLFPDTIALDREKITIANRSFFRTANIITVPISSLVSAEATVGPFFGSIHMTSKYFVQNTHSVHFLRRQDATEVHRLLQGYIIAQERNVDVSDVEKEDLKALLHDLGQGVSD